ncbi:outer membrane lipoprotein-sorting protein [Neptuniibacter sp. PT8_73]|uniref:outer membrane lipoprotein-sorting protein n=1 Tax=unclassified Neptuniibacter TaxID=2630693 RepID=UPI0039F66A9D
MTLLTNPLKSVCIAGMILTSGVAIAETAEEKGLRIAEEAKASDLGWTDMQAQMNMILRNKQGQESVREIRMKSLEVDNDGDKSLSVFDKPRDVKGTAFLSFSHPVGADDQWLYLPALKRVKRIASRNKSGPFMGSEFAYEDLSSFEVEKYTYKYLRDEACEGGTCYVVEQYPVDKNSGYTRRVVWLDQAEYRPWKIDFYDRKDSELKTLTYHEYKEYEGKHWRPDLMKMVNHQTGKSTDLTYGSYQFKTGLTDKDFNKNTLKRAR